MLDNGGVGGASADWAENDPENPSYVKNRTHWSYSGPKPPLIEPFNIKPGYGSAAFWGTPEISASLILQNSDSYNVTVNGTIYEGITCHLLGGTIGDTYAFALGNSRMNPLEFEDSYYDPQREHDVDLPFCLIQFEGKDGDQNSYWYLVHENSREFEITVSVPSQPEISDTFTATTSDYTWITESWGVFDDIPNYVDQDIIFTFGNTEETHELIANEYNVYYTTNVDLGSENPSLLEGNFGIISYKPQDQDVYELILLVSPTLSETSGPIVFSQSGTITLAHQLDRSYIPVLSDIPSEEGYYYLKVGQDGTISWFNRDAPEPK